MICQFTTSMLILLILLFIYKSYVPFALFIFYFTLNVDFHILRYIHKLFFVLFSDNTLIYHAYIDLLVLPYIYNSYVQFAPFMFCFTFNIDLQVLYYI